MYIELNNSEPTSSTNNCLNRSCGWWFQFICYVSDQKVFIWMKWIIAFVSIPSYNVASTFKANIEWHKLKICANAYIM
jgi:hypothetical protein